MDRRDADHNDHSALPPDGASSLKSRQASEEEGICRVACTRGNGRRVARDRLPVRLPRVPFHQRRRRRGGHAPSHGHRGRALAFPRLPVARQPLTAVSEAAPLRSERLLDLNARQRGVDANAKSAGNGFNSRQLHRITGRSYREEATRPSYDLLTAVRTRRHHWLGHILRMAADRLVRCAVLALGQRDGPPYQPGSILHS